MSEDIFKWDVKQRLTLLEATVFWTGELVTGFLTNTFSISRVQATKDIAMYLAHRPENLRYDRSLKRYLITEKFQPLLISGNPQECLEALKASVATAAPVLTIISNLPNVAVMAPQTRQIDPGVLRPILHAAKFGLVLEVAYQSASRVAPAVHTIQPHSLVFDGLHWHVRAYSLTDSEFRDYRLSRFHCAVLLGKPESPSPTDELWEETVIVEIGAHPGLNESQKSVVERDYGMVDGRIVTEVKAALVKYFLRSMQIGNDDLQREAMDQQVVLLNRQALERYLQIG